MLRWLNSHGTFVSPNGITVVKMSLWTTRQFSWLDRTHPHLWTVPLLVTILLAVAHTQVHVLLDFKESKAIRPMLYIQPPNCFLEIQFIQQFSVSLLAVGSLNWYLALDNYTLSHISVTLRSDLLPMCPLSISNCICNIFSFLCDIEVNNMTFDHNKTAPKKRKKQLAAKEMGDERRSTLSIRCVHW